MEKKEPGFEDVFFSDGRGDSRFDSDLYESAMGIADDLKGSLLAELELKREIELWESDFSLLSGHGWVQSCNNIVETLVRLRESSPLDIVGIGGLTQSVYLRPLLCSLALAMRGLVQRVVVIDCDLRAPSLHTVTNSETKEGFIDMVQYGCSFFAAATETEVGGVYVIPAGSHPVSSEEELMGRELERVFHSLRAKADITLVCVPPFLDEEKINPILDHMDGVLLCANRTGSRRASIRRDFSRLWQSDIPIIGIVSQEAAKPEIEEPVAPRAHVEEPAGEEERTPSTAARNETLKQEDTQTAHYEDAVGEEMDSVDGEVTASEQEATPRDLPQGEEVESEEESPADESDLVEKTLFGEKPRRRRLPYVIGICAAALIIGVLGIREAGHFRSESPEMDSRTVRSIVLPGSDGITTADEPSDEPSGPPMVDTPAPSQADSPAEIESPAVEEGYAKGEELGTIYVHISSFKSHENATRDSLRVATAGLRSCIALVEFEDLGRWYRVLVGPFETQEDAESVASQIESLGLARKTRIIWEGVGE